ncbi:FCD domain-containing protein [Celerinatantimonas sp. YJH-8]|uniref:FCD domain-containing protein n=1 Tax=Celerinatantimonas sp. YJH-8 TaxID=3228714 RepID=UPI0038C904AA
MAQELKRQYQDIAYQIRNMLQQGVYQEGERLPPERNFSEQLGVGRSVIREALLMLEIEGYVAVKKGSGVYVLPSQQRRAEVMAVNFGPFEILQARQLLESNIAEFAARQVTATDIQNMRAAIEAEKRELDNGGHEEGDKRFHQVIAEATHNSLLVGLWYQAWDCRENNPMWMQLHGRISNHEYRREWLHDHQLILAAMQKKDPMTAKRAMWQHLENVKQRLMALSNIDAPEFDGYLFESYPINTQS